jgi:NAD dependent epimerase/dehydratase family enzyme
LGNGNQWFPWIHIWDLVNAILHLFNRQDLSGPFNLSAPAPVRNREFAESVSLVLNRPNWFHIPAIVLKAALSERAKELLLTSQRVVPKRLIESGYEFRFDRIEAALRDLLSKSEVNE